MRVYVSLCAIVVTLAFTAGCAEKPSCKLLYKRLKSCAEKKSKLGDVSESTFVELCEKLKDKDKGGIADEIACSANKSCDKFNACVKDKRKARRAERLTKRFQEASEKAKAGDYSSVLSFCKYDKDDLTDALKKECEGLPAKAIAAMTKDIAAKRDKGTVDHKDVKCWQLTSLAKDVGAEQLKAAEALCKEVDLVRNMARTKKEIEKQLTAARPSDPYYCWEQQLAKMDELGTPFAKKAKAELVELCFKKLGKVILEKAVPTMGTYCSVKRTYEGIKKYGIKDPDIDKLMEDAKKACEK